MALSDEQRDALESLPIDRELRLMIYPTLLPRNYAPLLPLASADRTDLLEYGRERGWSEFEMGRILGAAQFMSLVLMIGPPDEWQRIFGGTPE